jgi:hypothetical protein
MIARVHHIEGERAAPQAKGHQTTTTQAAN